MSATMRYRNVFPRVAVRQSDSDCLDRGEISINAVCTRKMESSREDITYFLLVLISPYHDEQCRQCRRAELGVPALFGLMLAFSHLERANEPPLKLKRNNPIENGPRSVTALDDTPRSFPISLRRT